MTYSVTKRKFDVVIVGAGGSGMRASLQLARAGLNVAVLSKVFPTRSHTVAAQGGIGASLGNMNEDNWHYHFYDTVKGSDWLGDQDAIEFMCREAPKVVYDLEHMGMPFDRNPDGTIYQRPVWRAHGQLRRKGSRTGLCGGRPYRPRHAAHALPAEREGHDTAFFVEWMALDLIRDSDGDVVGVTALEMETGDAAHPAGEDRPCSPPAAPDGSSRPPPMRSSTPATAWVMAARAGHGARGHGVLAIPPHRRGRRGRAADRGLPR